jgi:hypothetical protein
MVKRLLVVVLVLCAGSAQAQAPDRSVEKEYTFVEFRHGPGEAYIKGINTFRFKPQAGERWVSISIEDSVVDNVPGTVYQFTAISYPFCGSTSEPVPVVPRKPVVVRLGQGSCDTPNVLGTGTHIAGTITGTFSR